MNLKKSHEFLEHSHNVATIKIESLEADNARLKSKNARYEKRNKDLQKELNTWNESPVTEKVRELTAKVKEQADLLIECSAVLSANNFRGDLQDSISDLINHQ